MKKQKAVCLVVALALVLCAIPIPAKAVQVEKTSQNTFSLDTITPYATGSFSMSLPAKSYTVANSSFHLAAWETITINASYSPASASVDFGVVDEDGNFYYVNVTNGSINKTIKVDSTGDYTIKVRNNSSVAVEVSGYVNY